MDIGPAELLIVLVIALVLFGGKKLPELAKGLGSAKKEYERGLAGEPAEPEVEVPTPEPVVVEAIAAPIEVIEVAEAIEGPQVVSETDATSR
ncbi:hypothetical protein BH10ACT1_BH10ACT1_31960 [soil metagenome]